MVDELVPVPPAPVVSDLALALTRNFFAWELNGRGWRVWDHPVPLEPPFRRFNTLPVFAGPPIDDGRHPTFFRAMADAIQGLVSGMGAPERFPAAVQAEELEAPRLAGPILRHVLQISLPAGCLVAKETTERLMLDFGYLAHPLSFEFIGDGHHVHCQIAAASEDAVQVEQTLRVYLPEASLLSSGDVLATAWNSRPRTSAVVDFGLSEEFLLPLGVPKRFDPHPVASSLAALAGLSDGECGILQVLLQPVRSPWSREMMRAILGPSGDGLFDDPQDLVAACRQKTARPLFAAVVRVAAAAPEEARSWHIARAIASGFGQLSAPGGNTLIPLNNDGYPEAVHEADLLARTSRRSGMILNNEELAALTHFADGSVRLDNISREFRRTKAAPDRVTGALGTIFGVNEHRGKKTPVRLTLADRLMHCHCLGATGSGKSTFLLNLILQDLESGYRLAVCDPHGDLIDGILSRLPAARLADVTILDPADQRGCVPINILAAQSDRERTVLASDLVAIFRRFSNSWGDGIQSVLGNAISAFLESSRGGTLLDLRRFLLDREFREDFLTTVADDEIVFFWQKTFPLLGARSIGPLLSRLDTFLRPKPVRAIVAGGGPGLDIEALLNSGVLLARLAVGEIGEENAYTLGSILVAKLHQAAFARQGEGGRQPFFLYADEVHHMATLSMARVLSGGRKHGIALICAHQDLEQLKSVPEVEAALISNAFTRACFRMGDADARKLAEGFAYFRADDLKNLGRGQAIVRVGEAQADFNLRIDLPPALDPVAAVAQREAALTASAARYGLPRALEAPSFRPASTTNAERPPVQHAERRGGTPAAPVAAAKPAPQKQPRPVSQVVPDAAEPMLGRGGREHKYLQHLIKRLAEERGFRAVIEEPVADGRVDVALHCDQLAIACEISVASSSEQEAQNLAKCLAASYATILMVATDSRRLRAIERLARERLRSDELRKITFLLPESLAETLDGLAPPPPQEKTVRGYKVKLSRTMMTPEDAKDRREIIGKVVARSLRAQRDRNQK